MNVLPRRAISGRRGGGGGPWRSPRFWAWFVSYWVVFALLFSVTHYVRGEQGGYEVSPWQALAVAFSDTAFMATFCLGVFALAWGLPLEGERRQRGRNLVAAALLAAVAVILLQWLMTTASSAIVGVPVPSLRVLVLLAWPTQLLLFSSFLGAGYAIRYFVTSREQAVAAAALEAQLANADLQLTRAQLQVLKMQLDPHFLFNTINGISTLMERDAEEANRMLMELSDLLRLTLARSGDQEVTLGEELDFLRTYLKIQQTRFGDRLQVVWEIQPGIQQACVPHLLLQPLVENAIQHGVSRVRGAGQVAIAAVQEGASLVLRIQDSGPGLSDVWDPGNGGLGLSATHARLEQMYGDQQELSLQNAEAGGAMVTVRIPYRVEQKRSSFLLPTRPRDVHARADRR